MLENSISSLDNLQNRLNDESCLPKEPFIKLGDGTQAPTLNYNLPESSSFSTYGDVPLGIDSNLFTPEAKTPPGDNFFSRIQLAGDADINQSVKQTSNSIASESNFLVNSDLIQEKAYRKRAYFDDKPQNYSAADKIDNRENQQQSQDYTNEEFDNKIAEMVKDKKQPVAYRKLGGFKTVIKYLTQPVETTPSLFIIEEYVTSSFLGAYGAGRAIKTFSLFPGEKTKISIKTYKDIKTTQSSSKNVLDSFSEESTDEIESLIQEESAKSVNTTSSSSRSIDASLSGKLFGITLGAKAKKSKNKTASRSSNITALNKAFNKHVASSNSNRKVEVNTSTSTEQSEGEEQTIVREFENINQSRTLNFIFRQLLQEYISITYLANIKIAFTNGYMESVKVVDIEDIDNLLEDIIIETERTNVKNEILKHYEKVLDYRGNLVNFLGKKEVTYGANFGDPITETYWTRQHNFQAYKDGAIDVNLPGVILSVKKNILRTSSTIVDSLLGQGQALDCFNLKAQDAIAVNETIKNMETLQKIEIVESQTTPEAKADAYQKIYSEYYVNDTTSTTT